MNVILEWNYEYKRNWKPLPDYQLPSSETHLALGAIFQFVT